jgi:ribulose-phosphate 3-epimerase
MDGHFVPNITFGPDLVKAIRPYSKKLFDVHLMIAPVDPYIEAFAKAGADLISFHVEAGAHSHRTLQLIRSFGKKSGIVICPGTPASAIAPLIDMVDLMLVMSVNPGFGGQSFIQSAAGLIADCKALIGDRPIDLEVDGGITPNRAAGRKGRRQRRLVAGSAAIRAAAVSAKSVGCRLPANLALSELQQYKWCMSASDDSHSRRSDKAHGVKRDMEVFCTKQSGAQSSSRCPSLAVKAGANAVAGSAVFKGARRQPAIRAAV